MLSVSNFVKIIDGINLVELRTLDATHNEIMKMQKKTFWKKFFSFMTNPKEVEDLRKCLDEAIDLFQVRRFMR